MNKKSARVMVAILLNGKWTREAALQRLEQSLGAGSARLKWPGEFVRVVFGVCAASPLAPNAEALERILQRNSAVKRSAYRGAKAIDRVVAKFKFLDLPPSPMSPASEAAVRWNVPAIVTTGQLARELELEVPQLSWLADCRGWEQNAEKEKVRNYRYQWIRKSNGGRRLVEAPKQNLKRVQRWIATKILSQIPVHDAAHAYRAGRSAATCAALHVGQHVVLRVDLRDFFPSIRAARVLGIFKTAGYPVHIARLLTGLSTNTTWRGVLDEIVDTPAEVEMAEKQHANLFRAHLPQGAPTSPALANLTAWSMDCRLSGLAAKFSASYSRYADDLIFSGDRSFARRLSRFRVAALAIVCNEGFEIRNRKTLVMRNDQRQLVTGLVVNTKPNIARCDFDRLKAILTNCGRHGPASQNRAEHPDFKAHLRGRVAYVGSVNASKAETLRHLFDAIAWDQNPSTTATD